MFFSLNTLNCDIRSLKAALFAISWPDIFANINVNQMVEAYTNIVLDADRAHILHKCVTISDKDAPWITNSVKNAIKKITVWLRNGKKNYLHKLISEAKTRYIENLGKKSLTQTLPLKYFGPLTKD